MREQKCTSSRSSKQGKEKSFDKGGKTTSKRLTSAGTKKALGKQDLTQSQLKEILRYDPATGIFIRIKTLCGRAVAGNSPGWIDSNGYRRIRINDQTFLMHRLVWLYMHGHFPHGDVDHINHDPADNRLVNLRPATVSQNMQNKLKGHRNGTSGYLGVSFSKQNQLYVAYINVNKKRTYLGYFKTAREAHNAYLKEKRRIHEYNTL